MTDVHAELCHSEWVGNIILVVCTVSTFCIDVSSLEIKSLCSGPCTVRHTNLEVVHGENDVYAEWSDRDWVTSLSCSSLAIHFQTVASCPKYAKVCYRVDAGTPWLLDTTNCSILITLALIWVDDTRVNTFKSCQRQNALQAKTFSPSGHELMCIHCKCYWLSVLHAQMKRRLA